MKYLSLIFRHKIDHIFTYKNCWSSHQDEKIYRPENVPTAKSPDRQTSQPRNFWPLNYQPPNFRPPNSRPPNRPTAEYLTGACHSAVSLTAELVPDVCRRIVCSWWKVPLQKKWPYATEKTIALRPGKNNNNAQNVKHGIAKAENIKKIQD